jgi:hypothetical protein
LGIAGTALGSVALGEDDDFAVGGHFESKGEAGNAGSYYQEINFVSHSVFLYD